MDIQAYISYYPNFKKVKALSEFLDSIKNGYKLSNNKVLICQKNAVFFYSSLISFLNFSSFVTKRHKILNKNKKEEKY